MNQKYRSGYLKTRWWNKRRSAWFRKNGYYCRGCGSRRRIDCHHLTYERLYKELDGDLTGLCRARCHPLAHKMYDTGRFKTRRDATQAAITKVKHGYQHQSAAHELLRLLPFVKSGTKWRREPKRRPTKPKLCVRAWRRFVRAISILWQ